MKLEYHQRAEDGGFPAPNGAGFRHGEAVYVVSKDEYDALLAALRTLSDAVAQEGHPDGRSLLAAMIQASAAIAKAEGR